MLVVFLLGWELEASQLPPQATFPKLHPLLFEAVLLDSSNRSTSAERSLVFGSIVSRHHVGKVALPLIEDTFQMVLFITSTPRSLSLGVFRVSLSINHS